MNVRSDNTELIIMYINKVGISVLRDYVNTHHPRENFDRNIAILRDYIKSGKSFCVNKYKISPSDPNKLLNRYYKYAKQAERMGSDGCD